MVTGRSSILFTIWFHPVRTGSGNLKLINWKVAADGGLQRAGDSGDQAGPVTRLAITHVRYPTGFDNLVTAIRTENGKLKLINWKGQADGSVKRIGDSGDQAGAITDVAIAPMLDGSVTTAVRTSSGVLKLIGWKLAGDGSVDRIGDSAAQVEPVSEVSIVKGGTGSQDLVLTAVRDGNGRLKLISWSAT